MRGKLSKWSSLLLGLLMSSQTQATVLYVRYTSNEIIIATDSKRTAETGQTVCVCKVSRIGDTFVASAGLAEYGSFDPKEFAREAVQSSNNLPEIRDNFEQLIQQPLIAVLKKLRVRSPARYAVFKQGAAVNMVFVRFGDVPELAATALTPRDTRDGSIVLDSHPITLSGPVKRALRIAVGISRRADAFLDRPSFWAKGTVPAFSTLCSCRLKTMVMQAARLTSCNSRKEVCVGFRMSRSATSEVGESTNSHRAATLRNTKSLFLKSGRGRLLTAPRNPYLDVWASVSAIAS